MSMINNLPKQYQDSRLVKYLDKAASIMEFDPHDLSDQTILETMSWQLPVEEEIAGLRAVGDEESRKEFLRAKWLSQFEHVGIPGLKKIAYSFKNGGIDIKYSYPVISVSFTEDMGIPSYIDEFKNALRMVIPAHIRINYQYQFQTHNDLKIYTHTQLAEFTHSQIRNGGIT